jgi:hypothetical protein
MLPLIINSNWFIRKYSISKYWTKTCYMYFSSEKLQKRCDLLVCSVLLKTLLGKFCYYYYNVEFEFVFLLFIE